MTDLTTRPRRALSRLALALAAVAAVPAVVHAQRLLVPMDDGQSNHLKAYGLTYSAIKAGMQAEWLLNYRGGAFLLPDAAELRRRAGLDGIAVETVSDAQLGGIRREMAGGNMESVPLEKAPRIAVYSPPGAQPWDDAVTLALKYAGIEFTAIYDTEVARGDLTKFDWLHLHHEDFTGQFNKFHLGYRDAPWFRELVAQNLATARKLGFSTVPGLKKEVAERIRQFVERGGFLFAMCGATETLELAIAGRDVDIAGEVSDGSPMDPNSDAKMQWRRSLAFKDARLEHSPFVNSIPAYLSASVTASSQGCAPGGEYTAIRGAFSSGTLSMLPPAISRRIPPSCASLTVSTAIPSSPARRRSSAASGRRNAPPR